MNNLRDLIDSAFDLVEAEKRKRDDEDDSGPRKTRTHTHKLTSAAGVEYEFDVVRFGSDGQIQIDASLEDSISEETNFLELAGRTIATITLSKNDDPIYKLIPSEDWQLDSLKNNTRRPRFEATDDDVQRYARSARLLLRETLQYMLDIRVANEDQIVSVLADPDDDTEEFMDRKDLIRFYDAIGFGDSHFPDLSDDETEYDAYGDEIAFQRFQSGRLGSILANLVDE